MAERAWIFSLPGVRQLGRSFLSAARRFPFPKLHGCCTSPAERLFPTALPPCFSFPLASSPRRRAPAPAIGRAPASMDAAPAACSPCFSSPSSFPSPSHGQLRAHPALSLFLSRPSLFFHGCSRFPVPRPRPAVPPLSSSSGSVQFALALAMVAVVPMPTGARSAAVSSRLPATARHVPVFEFVDLHSSPHGRTTSSMLLFGGRLLA
ncbi:uncharacterized protein [Zea mays]|uniref:Uncharacterized protein n=1 Tax=Zea mays TaxID=4577 RepID=B8A144_MAIZE|nr:uncharacterized protein LOC118471894 [Zea mays]ACL53893.1 unknown [Zea mays]|eukprot:XP_008645366.1 uncharacterized protein LOC103626783 [Zea mays]